MSDYTLYYEFRKGDHVRVIEGDLDPTKLWFVVNNQRLDYEERMAVHGYESGSHISIGLVGEPDSMGYVVRNSIVKTTVLELMAINGSIDD